MTAPCPPPEVRLNRIRLIARTPESVLATVNTGGWVETGACRIREVGAESDTTCTYLLRACGTTSGFTWSQIANGPCVPDEEAFRNWVRFAGTSSADGSRGALETFVSGTTRVEESWEWETDAGRTLEEWSFYRGRATEANRAGTLRWDRRDPALLIGTFAWDTRHQWEGEFRPDGTRGRMTLQERANASAPWITREEVRWEPAHGSWILHDPDGEVVETRSW